MADAKASDIFIIAGLPMSYEISGRQVRLDDAPFTPDDTETAWDADSLTEYLGSDALRGKDMLLALDGEDSPYLTENCLLKDTDTPVAEQVQKLFVLDKNNMASPESAESE